MMEGSCNSKPLCDPSTEKCLRDLILVVDILTLNPKFLLNIGTTPPGLPNFLFTASQALSASHVNAIDAATEVKSKLVFYDSTCFFSNKVKSLYLAENSLIVFRVS